MERKNLKTMAYKDLNIDFLKQARQEMKSAKLKLACAKFQMKVYDAVYELTVNDKFSYQMAKYLEWDRILLSKEFTDEEKKAIMQLQTQYDLIK